MPVRTGSVCAPYDIYAKRIINQGTFARILSRVVLAEKMKYKIKIQFQINLNKLKCKVLSNNMILFNNVG